MGFIKFLQSNSRSGQTFSAHLLWLIEIKYMIQQETAKSLKCQTYHFLELQALFLVFNYDFSFLYNQEV